MPVVEIDATRCCGDALCVRVCPAACLRMRGDKAAPVPLSRNRCLGCGQWIAVEGEDKLGAFVKLVIDAMRAIPGTERLVAAFEQGRDPILREAPCVVFAHASADYDLSAADCALAVGYCELALHSMGLGTCWAGYALGVARRSPEVRAFLGVPEGREAYGGVMVGYPALRYHRIPDRKPARLVWV